MDPDDASLEEIEVSAAVHPAFDSLSLQICPSVCPLDAAGTNAFGRRYRPLPPATFRSASRFGVASRRLAHR